MRCNIIFGGEGGADKDPIVKSLPITITIQSNERSFGGRTCDVMCVCDFRIRRLSYMKEDDREKTERHIESFKD